jgi:hypothetical protein
MAHNQERIDLNLPMTMIICGCEICDQLMYVPWATANMYIQCLKDDPPIFPSKTTNFQVRVPPFPSSVIAGTEDYHAQNPSQKAADELKEILPNFSLLALMIRGVFIEDDVLRAARHIIENQAAPIRTMFALQLQLDIQRLGERYPIAAFSDLRDTFENVCSQADQYFKWLTTIDFKPWDNTWNKHVHTLIEQFEDWIEGKASGTSDPVEVQAPVDTGMSWADATRISRKVPVLEIFPVTCGLIELELLMQW